ncbi:hypothetical protein [Zobellia uliginosa]|uniref:hypothetical protein n=1 Tax=Zobellia uliginosa TaxID=143224 RepID=UPI001C073592|nr:hypothetical protein [Zobellia uliginosa]MBU2947839.1 hypothetical protein [Zobellia uliginosa]
MKKFKIFNLSLLVCIPLIFGIYFVSVYYFYYDNKDDSYSIETYFNFKESLAKKAKGNKILFSSGSNNFLGIRAYQVEDAFGVPAYNMSIHAGLKTDYIIDRLKPILNEGDIVILPLEYNNFTYNGEPSITLNKYLLTYDKEYFNTKYDYTEQLKMLSSINVIDLFSSLLNGKNIGKEEQRLEFLKNINENGDMLNMTIHDSLKTKKSPIKLPKTLDVEFKGLKAINEFNNYCNEKNISLFITFPNLIYDKAYENEKYSNYFNFIISFLNKNNIEIIGSPLQAMYPQNLFFDSEYHLISKGSDIRTSDFIEQLKNNAKAIDKLKSIKN